MWEVLQSEKFITRSIEEFRKDETIFEFHSRKIANCKLAYFEFYNIYMYIIYIRIMDIYYKINGVHAPQL